MSMESPLTEDQISQCLHDHFLALRKKQKNTGEQSLISDELKYVMSFTFENANNPAHTLKFLGIVVLESVFAFNLISLQPHLVCSLNQISRKLLDEHWVEETAGTEKYKKKLKQFIKSSDLKKFGFFTPPDDADFSAFIREKNLIVATPYNFKYERIPEVQPIEPTAEAANLPEITHFPIVSIEYERVFETFHVLSIIPDNPEQKRRFTIESFSFDLSAE